MLGGSRDLDQGEWPEAWLVDLKKAKPQGNKPALWMLLSKYGLGENMIRVIKGLHETTSYKVRGMEGVSREWLPERGLRKEYSTSPVLFNIYHQAVMRQAEVHKRELGGEGVEVRFRWVPGGSFVGTKT